MMCCKCNGRGVLANPRYYRHSNSEAWEMGIPATKPCKHCGGSGYIIGNIGDIVEPIEAGEPADLILATLQKAYRKLGRERIIELIKEGKTEKEIKALCNKKEK